MAPLGAEILQIAKGDGDTVLSTNEIVAYRREMDAPHRHEARERRKKIRSEEPRAGMVVRTGCLQEKTALQVSK